MNKTLEQMSNSELKTYIKANRNNEEACHEALRILLSRRNYQTEQYSYKLPEQEMEAIFRKRLYSAQK